MFPFTEIGPFDRTEKKALLLAALFCALFIGLLTLLSPAKRVPKKPLTTEITIPDIPFGLPEPSHEDPLARFRSISENFSDVDFQNFSYGAYSDGVYTSPDFRPLTLTLAGGMMWDDSGWFNLQDVYYKDVTGDGSPEAIVRLLHLRCHGSCDGGSDLFYIFSRRNGKLKNIWRYETGSYAYGCGLKSFTLGDKQIVVQLSDRCASQRMAYTVFDFDGGRFKTKNLDHG